VEKLAECKINYSRTQLYRHGGDGVICVVISEFCFNRGL